MNWTETKIDISKVNVNENYQRPLNYNWIRRIIREYDDKRVNQIILSEHGDGSLWVIDGNHTINATKIAKGEHSYLSAKIFKGLTEAEEADMYYHYNHDKKMMSYGDKLKARYTSGEKTAVEYIDALTESGVNWKFVGHGGKSNTIFSSHDPGETILRRYGRQVLIDTLRICNDCCAVTNMNGKYVSGIARLISKFKVDYGRLADRILATPQYEIERLGGQYMTGNGNNEIKYGRAFAEIYNKNLRRGRIDIAEI